MTKWSELTEWHDVAGMFRERMDPEAVEGIPDAVPVAFQVIRETWDETTEPPTRIVHELKLEP